MTRHPIEVEAGKSRLHAPHHIWEFEREEMCREADLGRASEDADSFAFCVNSVR